MAVTGLPKNFPTIARSHGLKVVEVPNWYGRKRPGSFGPGGVLCHHTGSYDGLADAENDFAYAKWLAITGRPDLDAPLCQLALSREGVVYVCASGRANHAGRAKPFGTMAGGDGNALYIGIEAMNDGSQGWSKAQYDAYVLLCAVLSAKVTGNSHKTVNAHKETSVTGKWDPGKLDMGKFRADVAAMIAAIKKPAPAPPRPRTVTSDKVIAVANIKSNPLMTPAQVASDYEKLFAGAARIGAHSLTICEHHSKYTAALKKAAAAQSFEVVISGEHVIAWPRKYSSWLVSTASSLISKGVAGVSPNRTVLRRRYRTKAGTQIVDDATHLPNSWANPAHPDYPKTKPLAEAGLRKLAPLAKSQAKTAAVFVSGDMNTVEEIDWVKYGGQKPAAVLIPKTGGAKRKFMQVHAFAPAGWTVKEVRRGSIAEDKDLNTDHAIIWGHFQITRPA